jgi:haloacetate dehalogenase
MARDMVALMRSLGHERFSVAGHDRGADVAYRTALDHPDAVRALAVLDSIPIWESLDRCDARFAAAWWHWWFLGQTEKPAERVISADPEAWYRPNRSMMGEENLADYLRAIHDPATVHAMCEDYRAGLGIDREHDDEDRRAGRRIQCPTLFMWSLHDDMEELYGDPLPIWEPWVAGSLEGGTIDSGHHMAEEAPEELTQKLRAFLAAVPTD